MTPSPLVQQRRDVEFAAANSRYEVDRLLQRWAAEDGAAHLAESTLAREVSDLRQRVVGLEAKLATTIKTANASLLSVDKDILAVAKAMASLRADIKAVEATVPKFCGVHEAARTYEAHSFVVKNGALWIAHEKTAAPPGTPSWQLVTKSGEVGK